MSPSESTFCQDLRNEIRELINRDLFFTNADCYNNEAEWLKELVRIITGKDPDTHDVGDDFIPCIERLAAEGYLVNIVKDNSLTDALSK